MLRKVQRTWNLDTPWQEADAMGDNGLNGQMEEALRVRHSLDDAARTLGQSAEANWAAWMRYLLETLEGQTANPDAYRTFLERLRSHIATRLEHGRW
jgi:hypothetical protein